VTMSMFTDPPETWHSYLKPPIATLPKDNQLPGGIPPGS